MIAADNPDLFAHLGDYDIHDGFRVDGSVVRFWLTKKTAVRAAKGIGWPVRSVTKVHTRFQVGWALCDTRFGALSRDGYATLVGDTHTHN